MKNKSILLAIILLIVGVMATGCMYSSLKSKDFKDHFGALGYTVSETETPKYDTGISYQVATKEDVPFKVEYYEFDEEVEAKKVYESYKGDIGKYITTDSDNNESYGALFSRIIAVSEKEYIVISRVRSTVIFIAGTKEYKNEIDSLLEEIGY